jgi:hypothetical protein
MSLDNIYAKEKLHGILRKESTKNLSNKITAQTSYHAYDCIHSENNHISETYDTWKNDECDCNLKLIFILID